MIINQKRIRSIFPHMKRIQQNQNIVICTDISNIPDTDLEEIGFSSDLEPGERVLPAAKGNITLFNSRGKEVPLKDQPMETHYRQQEWTWNEFRGRYDFEKRSKIVDIPYNRYPRKVIPPPSIELSISLNTNGHKLIVSDAILFNENNHELIIHVINVFLELFGICEIRPQSLEAIVTSPVRKLNWSVLPRGRRPWAQLEPLIRPIVNNLTKGNKIVIEKRFEAINAYEPDFVAVGQAGFSGYLIFGFFERNLYILESTQTNNATYVLENNWEHLSKLTKAEILEHNLHKARIIHRANWFEEIGRALTQ